MAGRPSACSGLRYDGVPSRSPARVWPEASAARAMPKSVSFTSPSSRTRMLAGLTSRCTTLASCATPSARAHWPITDRTWSAGSGPCSRISWESGLPSTSSMTRKAMPVVLAVVEQRGDVGVDQRGGVQRLVAEAEREELLVAGVGAHHLERDPALEDVVLAAQTSAMPPDAMRRSSR